MKITFYGGAGGVTGSKHLVEVTGARILLDCGFFQGHRKETRELNSALPFAASSIDAVVLSHAHLDHCGMLPLLVKEGFGGNIYATSGTRDVAEWILKDAAHIQMHDAEYLRRKRSKGARYAEPLYTLDDIPPVLEKFVEVPYVRNSGEWFALRQAQGDRALEGIRIKLYDAGHIIGSSVIVLEAGEERLVFTGDLGRDGAPLLPNPEYVHEEASILLLESTYGARTHQDFAQAKERLAGFIDEVVKVRGKLIMPAFALGRTQEILYILHELIHEKWIPRIPIFVDSPLADRMTEVFKRHRRDFDIETWQQFGRRGDRALEFRNLIFTRSTEESKQLNRMDGPLIIISASGMCENGRILHHLKNAVQDARNMVLITGFQAMHTLGRRMLEGERKIRIFDRWYDVRARVEKLNELSAHADRNELLKYTEHVKGLKHVFLVHGEQRQAYSLRDLFRERHPEWNVRMPERGETAEVNAKKLKVQMPDEAPSSKFIL